MSKKSNAKPVDSIKVAWEDFIELQTQQFIKGEEHEYQIIRKVGNKELCLKVQGNGRFSGVWKDGVISIKKLAKK
jgi:hypothetical protein